MPILVDKKRDGWQSVLLLQQANVTTETESKARLARCEMGV